MSYRARGEGRASTHSFRSTLWEQANGTQKGTNLSRLALRIEKLKSANTFYSPTSHLTLIRVQ